MSDCLPDLPRYIRQRDNQWQGADDREGPWHPIPAPQSGLPWRTDGPAVPESREPASVVAEANHTPADRLALALCQANSDIGQCAKACEDCRFLTAAVTTELAKILRERHGGSSQVADWLDGVGTHH
jgi:hypothetical protein